MIRWFWALIFSFLPSVGAAQNWLSLEQDLAALYLPTGKVDGEVDQQTYEAIELFLYTFGYPVQRTLDDEQRSTLARAAIASQSPNPFIFEERRPVWDEVERYFLGASFSAFERKIYANGQHFMMMRTGLPYHPENVGKHSDKFQVNTERVLAYSSHAKALAKQSQNPLAQAAYILTTSPDEKTGKQDTLSALYTVLPVAEANPTELAMTALLAEGVARRLPDMQNCREWRQADQFSNLLTRAVVVAGESGLEPYTWSSLALAAAACANGEKRDGLYQLRYEHALNISEYARREVLLNWARDAASRNNDDRAREALKEAMLAMSARPVLSDSFFTETDALIPTQDAVLMERLGLNAEAEQLAEAHVTAILRRPPLRSEASRVEIANYYYTGRLTATMLLDLQDAEKLQRLSLKVADFPNPNDQSALSGPWSAAQYGLRGLMEQEAFGRVIQNGRAILSSVSQSPVPKAHVIVNLLIAEAAIELGDFELAETHLASAQTIAALQGLIPIVEERITAIQEGLSVFALQSLPLADRVIERVKSYYGNDCNGGPGGREAGYFPFPYLPFEEFSNQPDFAKTIIQSNLISLYEKCHPANSPNRQPTRFQTRLFCAVAAINGRADHVTALLKAKDGKYPNVETSIWCAYGLADVGLTQWKTRAGWATQDQDAAVLFNLLIAAPDARKQFLAHFAAQPFPEVGFNEIPWGFLSLDMKHEDRIKLLEDTRTSFLGSYGNIGPQDEDFRGAHLAGVALAKLGLYNIAEAMYFLDDRVDPFEFGTEEQEAIAEDLLDKEAIDKRLAYAQLYRAAGKYEKARVAIGPLVEMAVKRLSTPDNPLPGTVEQWSDRLSDAFELYLTLQFDPGEVGPNYDSLFLVQQFVQAAQSTASLSLIEQRLTSSSPETARAYQDAQHIMRTAMRDPNVDPRTLEEATNRLKEAEAGLSQEGSSLETHQIGVIRSLNEAVSVLGPGEVTLIVTQLDDVLIQTVLTERTAQARRLNVPRHSSTEQVTRFRASITNSRPGRERFDNRFARGLYDELVGWALKQQVPSRLNIVVDGVWAAMPFAALRTGDGWLAETTVLRASPSVSRIVAANEAKGNSKRGSRRGSFVGFGDPVFANYSRRPSVPAGAYLAALPETRQELTFLAAMFGGNPKEDVFTGANANEDELNRLNAEGRLKDNRILALATHGLLSRDAVGIGEASLVLSDPNQPSEDGFLSASELYSYEIGADLVILSACNTGTPGAAGGISDLASAFFYAGAKGLLLTHWEIDSAAALEIMKHFAVSFRNDSSNADESLQFAVSRILKDQNLAKFHHPRFWASHFVLS